MLNIYPEVNYDSFISVVDADEVIAKKSVHNATWIALDEAAKEIYLRIATDRIFGVIEELPTDYIAVDSCLPSCCALMAIEDIVYSISSGVNENTGLVSKEKVGEIERQYFHGYSTNKVNGLNKNPFPQSVRPCLASYGATFNNKLQAVFLRS